MERLSYSYIRRGSRIQKGGFVHSEGGVSYRNFMSGSKLLQGPGQINKQKTDIALQTAVGGGGPITPPPKKKTVSAHAYLSYSIESTYTSNLYSGTKATHQLHK